MERKIKIVTSGIEAEALLNETDIASKVWENLPITSEVATRGDEIRPVSPVSLIGKVKGDLRVFKKISPESKITIEKG
jgi:hypothetical protein